MSLYEETLDTDYKKWLLERVKSHLSEPFDKYILSMGVDEGITDWPSYTYYTYWYWELKKETN